MLLSKALKMQQDTKDRKNKDIIEGLEDKIKKLEDSLKEKDSLLQSTEGSLVETRSQNDKLSGELDKARATLNERSERFDHETKELKAKVKAEAEKNAKLSETVKNLQDKCSGFVTRCITRLKGIFNTVGATSEEITPSTEDIPGAFEHIKNEVEALDEVITGHKDFCVLVASCGTTAAFMKAGCNHARAVNKLNFNLLSLDLVDVPTEARSIGNRIITQIWAKGGCELAGDEARKLLHSV
jgi:DNA repair exonuclease SbcCD ATPase subunit